MIYTPAHFSVKERATQLAVMREFPFATLATVAAQEPSFSHVPMVVEERGAQLVLLGHLAIANPHWRTWSAGQAAVAIFHGPNSYVSPRHYGVREAVPTWNYVAVHVQGRLVPIEDSAGKERILKALINEHDRDYHAQWDELGEEYRERMKRGIVGFELAVEHIDGKFKLSQNRVPQDRARVRTALAGGTPPERGVAEWMSRLGIGEP